MKHSLNTIIYGPAGTGKTRKMISLATSLAIGQNEALKETPFGALTSRPNLNIKESKLMEEIKDLNSDIDKIVKNKSYIGHLAELDDPNERISEYRAFPLIEMVTFHPSYSYQDFVEGISPETHPDGGITYKVKDGIFKNICNRALQNPQYNYVLLVDEINRGNISSIFGELFTLLEADKRKGMVSELSINLPYSKDKQGNPQKLIVPSNLYIVSTMNTVDKSIALIDVALRRRFDFLELLPDYDVLKSVDADDGIKLDQVLKAMNDRITVLKNEHYQIGHSYFLPDDFNGGDNKMEIQEIRNVFTDKIIPLLQEYFYDDWKSICAVLNQPSKEGSSSVDYMLNKVIGHEKVFLQEYSEMANFKNTATYRVNRTFSALAVKKIYS
jgi:5-methylcytosine-specific restriction protein B